MGKRRLLICVGALLLLALGSFYVTADERRLLKSKEGEAALSAPDRSAAKINKLEVPKQTPAIANKAVVGTIQYDTGTVTGTPGAGLVSLMVGNQFDTAIGGPVMASGSVTMVSFYLNTTGGASAFISLYGPVNGTTAPKLTSALFSGLVSGFNTVTFAPAINYSGPSFLAGVWLAGATADVVGLDSNLGTQGAHGIAIDDAFPSSTGTNFQTLPGSVNAIVRPTGNILVPVELMSFSIEGN